MQSLLAGSLAVQRCEYLLYAFENPCVEMDESTNRNDAGEDESEPVLVITANIQGIDDNYKNRSYRI